MRPIITTSRLTLRRMDEDDVPSLMTIFSDPVAMQYYPRTRTESEAFDWVHWNQTLYQEWGHGLWIVERRHDGAFLGQCGVIPQTVHEETELEIGYLFQRAQWGQGYATEAARAARDWAFQSRDITHLISIINPENTPSIRVAERNRMRFRERTVWHDKIVAVYSIQRTEWSPA